MKTKKTKKPESPVKQPQKQGGLPDHLKPYMFKPGESGNPKGRPKGQTLREWVRERFKEMSDKERIEFLSKVAPKDIWQMVEGLPKINAKVEHELPSNIIELLTHGIANPSPDPGVQEENPD